MEVVPILVGQDKAVVPCVGIRQHRSIASRCQAVSEIRYDIISFHIFQSFQG
jgi:hypothetical protein